MELSSLFIREARSKGKSIIKEERGSSKRDMWVLLERQAGDGQKPDFEKKSKEMFKHILDFGIQRIIT